MSEKKISVKPDTIFLEDLLNEIAAGGYKVPVFQRDFEWEPSQMLELFDSILKGYPIGSLLFWRTTDYPTRDGIGPYTVLAKESDFKYILDGFQRVSTLFGVLMNPKSFQKEENSEELKDFSIFFDIKKNNFTYVRSKKDKNVFFIRLYQIYDNRELFHSLRELEFELEKEGVTEILKNTYIDNARNLHDVLHKYKLPYVDIRGGDIKSAVEIFSRVNSTGTTISEDSMLSARSYNAETGFLLTSSITEFLNRLNIYNFDSLKRDTLLNCISSATGEIYFDVKVESLLENPNLQLFTDNAFTHIEKAVDFFYKSLFVIDIRLLPYPTQLIFVSEYFRINPNPTLEQLEALKNWFWVTTYANYFTLYSLSQQRSAYKAFCDFAKGVHPDGIYRVNIDTQFRTAKYPSRLNFAGVRPKAMQLFYLKSIIQNDEVQYREGVKEIFIFTSSKKDRTPGNVMLRLSSEFEKNKDKKQVDDFIRASPDEVLNQHFITQESARVYKQGRVEDFISIREEYLKLKEKEFVETLGIIYTN